MLLICYLVGSTLSKIFPFLELSCNSGLYIVYDILHLIPDMFIIPALISLSGSKLFRFTLFYAKDLPSLKTQVPFNIFNVFFKQDLNAA